MTEVLPQLFETPSMSVTKPDRQLLVPVDELAQERIVRVYNTAELCDIASGTSWYFDANALCAKLAEQTELDHISPLHVAAIMAALSPMRSWTDNIRQTREVLATGTTRGLGHTVKTANAIWHGFDPEYMISRTGQNLKVQSFFKNIAFPASSNEVTIDRHMWTLLSDDKDFVKKAGLYFKPHEYQWAAEQFKQVAAKIQLLPHQLQAIAWVAWRRKQGIVEHANSYTQHAFDI